MQTEVVPDTLGNAVPFNGLVCVVVYVNVFVYDTDVVNVNEVLFVLIDVDEPVTDLVRIREPELDVLPEDEPVEEEEDVDIPPSTREKMALARILVRKS